MMLGVVYFFFFQAEDGIRDVESSRGLGDVNTRQLAGCMSTIMGIVAERKGINLEGMTVEVAKHMNADPRRIGKLEVVITVPLPSDYPDRKLLEQAALSCPVKHSLHPDMEIPITWKWVG